MVNLPFHKLQRQLGFQFPNSSVQKQRGSHHTMWWMWKKPGHFLRFYFNMNSKWTFYLKGRQVSAKRILRQYSLTYFLQQFYISVLNLRYQTTAIFAGSSSKLGGGGEVQRKKKEKSCWKAPKKAGALEKKCQWFWLSFLFTSQYIRPGTSFSVQNFSNWLESI